MHHSAVPAAIDLLGFLTLGLLGGFGHCVGMCSPFVLFVSRRYAPPEGRHPPLAAQLWYTAGRVVTYAALGAVAGALGGLAELGGAFIGLRRGAAFVAGAVLVLWALGSLSSLVPGFSDYGGRLFARLLPKRRAPGHPFTVGLMLGLLPCGFLYAAVIAAVALGGPLRGAAALVLFGLGTAPALLGVSFADALLSRRAIVNRVSQVFVLAMGVWFMWRALA